MNDTKFLKAIIAILLIINIIALVSIWTHRPVKLHLLFKDELGFSEVQMAQLRVLQDEHHTVALKLYDINTQEHDKLIKFCKDHNIEFEHEPKWFLTSYWG